MFILCKIILLLIHLSTKICQFISSMSKSSTNWSVSPAFCWRMILTHTHNSIFVRSLATNSWFNATYLEIKFSGVPSRRIMSYKHFCRLISRAAPPLSAKCAAHTGAKTLGAPLSKLLLCYTTFRGWTAALVGCNQNNNICGPISKYTKYGFSWPKQQILQS